MIDYIKIAIKDAAITKYLLTNLDGLFDYYRSNTTRKADNEVTHVLAFYKGLKFKLTQSGVTIIDGSLHKAMNNGKHNHNDFSYEDLLRVIAELCARFNINPHFAYLQNLEVGVNVTTPFDPQEFTDRCAFLFTNAGVIKPSPITKRDRDGYDKGIRFELSEYAIKTYNKGAQYGLDENILRVEYKTYKTRAIKAIEIKTLYDLCDSNKLKALVESYLMAKYAGLMVDEIVDDRHLNARERKLYNKRLDYNLCWSNVSRSQRRLNRGYINRIYTIYAQSDIKSIVGHLMRGKANRLLRVTPACAELIMAISNTNYVRNHILFEGWERSKLAA